MPITADVSIASNPILVFIGPNCRDNLADLSRAKPGRRRAVVGIDDPDLPCASNTGINDAGHRISRQSAPRVFGIQNIKFKLTAFTGFRPVAARFRHARRVERSPSESAFPAHSDARRQLRNPFAAAPSPISVPRLCGVLSEIR
jgi:hypothetical protein